MAWKVLVVLLVTSGCGEVSVSADHLIHSKNILLKPTATSTNITITARGSFGTVGVTVPLNECFSSGVNCWEFSQVQVKKEYNRHFLFSLSVGSCKMNCRNEHGDIKSNLEEIEVIPYGLRIYPEPKEPVLFKVKIEDCTSSLQTKIPRQTPSFCACSTNAPTSTATTDASPPHASTSSAFPRPSSRLPQTPSHATTSKSIVRMLVVVEVVQVLGTCVMAVAVVVVIRRSSRGAAAIKSGSPLVLQDDTNVSHEQSRDKATEGTDTQK